MKQNTEMMKTTYLRIVALLLVSASVLLTGCAAKFQRQAFNNEAATHVKKITITQWDDQEEYRAVVVNHPGMSFGLIGAAIAAADTATKTKKLNDAIKPETVKLASAFYEKALPGLKQLGYETISVPIKRQLGEKADVIKDRVASSRGQDASLMLNISASYLAAGASTFYLPSVVLDAELVDNKSKAVIYREAYHYGYNNGQTEVVHIDAAADCKFQDIVELTANIDKTRRCLLDSVEVLVGQFLSDLKK